MSVIFDPPGAPNNITLTIYILSHKQNMLLQSLPKSDRGQIVWCAVGFTCLE